MSSLKQCRLCGRRGVRDFVAADSTTWRCVNQDACSRRQCDAELAGRPGFTQSIERAGESADSAGSATAAAVAGLAREIEAVRHAVDQMHELSTQIDDLARVVTELAGQLAQLSASTINPVAAPSWLDLPDNVRAATALLRDLISWLGDVYLRYADAARSLPNCWLWHPEVVEELLWLMYAWHAAYRAEDATVHRAGDWHDRYRPGVVRRIQELARHCSVENHLPRDGQPAGSQPVVPLAEALAPIADWWATRRGETPPQPTREQLAQSGARDRRSEGGRR